MYHIDIAYTINHKYVKYLIVSLTSLFESNKRNHITLHIVFNDLTQSDQNYIDEFVQKNGGNCFFYYIDDLEFFKEFVSYGFGIEVFLRLYLPWKLLKITKVLYLDADTIIKGDIGDFFSLDMEGYVLAGCLDGEYSKRLVESRNDIFKRTDNFNYFNAGVMLWNLELIRTTIRFEDFINTIGIFGNRLFFNDQDILNYLFYQETRIIDGERFNFMGNLYANDPCFDKKVNSAKIIHYAGCNPWKKGWLERVDFDIWWNCAKKSDFYGAIVDETLRNTATMIDDIEKRYQMAKAYSEYKLRGGSLENNQIFKENKKIAIYGAGAWAKLLIEELGEAKEKIQFIFDKKTTGNIYGCKICNLSEIENANMVDIIIVTPSMHYDEIYMFLKTKINIPILNLVEIWGD